MTDKPETKHTQPTEQPKTECCLCIHGHFYQPPRDNPFTGRIPREPSAAPYLNWNQRINAESYAPNAKLGNFSHISFNMGDTLISWLEHNAPQTYQTIIDAENDYQEAHSGASNALAQPVHHTILPLSRRRDKICQVRWGVASFEHHFGHKPLGMWLPEMAVDYETLEILAAEGIHFTILSDEQVHGHLDEGAGPYRVQLPSGGNIAIFVRDRHLSNIVSFQMPQPEGVEAWMEEQMVWRFERGGLQLVATDGETFGHHHAHGTQVLQRIWQTAQAKGYHMTTLSTYLRNHPPQVELDIVENTSWSCHHNIARWVTGCDCTPGNSTWKAALRRALDNLAANLDFYYAGEAAKLGVAPWKLRDDYIAVMLGQIEGPELLAQHGLVDLSGEQNWKILMLLEAQYFRQRMFASCAYFFEDLERLEPRYAMANALRAIALTRYATGRDLTNGFRRDLRVAISNKTGRTGTQILDEILRQARM